MYYISYFLLFILALLWLLVFILFLARSEVSPGSSCAVVTYSPAQVLQDFSSDGAVLERAICQLKYQTGQAQTAKAMREAKRFPGSRGGMRWVKHI